MLSFTGIYALIALFILIAAAAFAYFLKGWKAALIVSAVTFFILVAGIFGLIALVTWNM